MKITPVSLNVTNLENFVYDMSRCVKCKGCNWVDHIYMPGVKFSSRCPTVEYYKFDSYGAYGKMRIGVALTEQRLDYSPKLLEIIYSDPLCGACDVACKRNLDLEIGLTLEAIRVRAVRDGAGPMPEHKKIAENILRSGNCFGEDPENRIKLGTEDKKKGNKHEAVIYYVGCAASYKNGEIYEATKSILEKSQTPFAVLKDEKCCGNVLYSVGLIDEARELARENLSAMRSTKCATLVTSCAECFRMWKVDYPKLLDIGTDDLGFRVIHTVELVDELIKGGRLQIVRQVDKQITYHDSCSLGRLSEPWIPWKGDRGLYGIVNPPIERRRGTDGKYQPPRDVLKRVVKTKLIEMPRMRENAYCCGAGRGTKAAFPEFSLWAAKQRLEEAKAVGAEGVVSACPWCKKNFSEAVKVLGQHIDILDISEIIASAILEEDHSMRKG